MKSFKEFVGESIGEASMCWESVPNGVFDSSRASRIADDIVKRYDEMKSTYDIALVNLDTDRIRTEDLYDQKCDEYRVQIELTAKFRSLLRDNNIEFEE